MRNSKRVKIVAGGTAVLFGVGVAFAAWVSTGEDSASVTAGNEVDLTVLAVGDVEELYPGQTKDITVDVTNTNPYPVEVRSVVATAGDPTNALGPTCADTDVSISDDPSDNDLLAADNGTIQYTFTVTMPDDANSDCQFATFHYDFVATADSALTPAS